MNRIKHFMILALALAMSLGAWAQQEVLLTTVSHRLLLTHTARSQGITEDAVLEGILERIPAPKMR